MIAERIKYLRIQKDLTQASLAKKLGITRSSVNAWEMGITVPSTQYLVELSTLFGVTTDFLLGLNAKTLNVEGLNDDDTLLLQQIIMHLKEKNNHNHQ